MNHAFVGAEANRIAEEARYGAELTAVGAAPAGLNRNQVKTLPAHAHPAALVPPQPGKALDHVKLVTLPTLPPTLRVGDVHVGDVGGEVWGKAERQGG